MADYEDFHKRLDGVRHVPSGTNYRLPFERGDHSTFAKLDADREVRAAEDKELAYVFEGAFRAKTKGCRAFRTCVVLGEYVRNPKRLRYVPTIRGDAPYDSPREGIVFVQRDIKGEGLSTPLDCKAIPNNAWVEHNGIWVAPEYAIGFVRASKIKIGEHNVGSFQKDGLVLLLNEDLRKHPKDWGESTEVLVRIARDNKIKLRLRALKCSKIKKEEQRVTGLYISDDWLNVCADGGGSDPSCFVVGVFR